MSNNLHVIVLFTLKNRELFSREDFREQLTLFVRRTRRAPGNLLSVLLKSPDDPAEMCFSQVWENQKALDAHLESDYFRDFAPLIGKHMYSLAPRIMTEVTSI